MSGSIPLFGLAALLLGGAVYLGWTAHGWRDRIIAVVLLLFAAQASLSGMHERMSETIRDRIRAERD